MQTLTHANMVVIGGSEGTGREIVLAGARAGARVLAVARREAPLAALTREADGIETLSADMSDEATPERIFDAMEPQVIVVCAGATPAMRSLQDQTWETFSSAWETDVRGSFNVCKAALNKPLAPGATVVLISSGAGLAGSPISGGYAGAKRTQMFLAEYAQEESDRRRLGIRFLALVPRAIMPGTSVGNAASAAYARYRGVTVEEFLSRFDHPQTPADVASSLITLLTEEPARDGSVFLVDGRGLAEMH